MIKTLSKLVVALVFAAALNAGTAKKAEAASASGYDRSVAIWLLGVWLDHTYEYYSGYGFATFGGGASDGHTHTTTTTIYANEYTCMQKSGELTYAVTGVCHQGTNRGLYRTPIAYVNNWGDVGGAGTSNALYCTFGAGLWCYGAPC